VLETGAAAGFPVLVHHGTPMSRVLYEPWIRDAEERGIRLLSYNRPGYGGSSPNPGRTVGDAAADVRTIADALGIDRLGVWGISGGGPHALACAGLLADRVVGVGVIASIAPWNAEGLDWHAGMGEANVAEFELVFQGREALRPSAERDAAEIRVSGVEGMVAALASLLSPVDAAVLESEFGPYMFAGMVDGLSAGVEGWIDDDVAFVEPWGFELAEITVPVLLLQGREDRFVPPAHGEWLAAHIPGLEARITDEDGHLTLYERAVSAHEWLLARGG
jgi:pimeloyl-ACP methyl ester carboxylesterase